MREFDVRRSRYSCIMHPCEARTANPVLNVTALVRHYSVRYLIEHPSNAANAVGISHNHSPYP